MALSLAVLVYAVGYIVVASSTTIEAVAGGQRTDLFLWASLRKVYQAKLSMASGIRGSI
jgi:hypothetical protein